MSLDDINMSNEAKMAPALEEKNAIAPVATNPMYETGEVLKVDLDADPALAVLSGGILEYTEEEGKSVLSKIVSASSIVNFDQTL